MTEVLISWCCGDEGFQQMMSVLVAAVKPG